MKKSLFILLALSLSVSESAEEPLHRIAFGSCLRVRENLPVWGGILSTKPDLFIFMGDNVYADTRDPETLRSHYERLGALEGFKKLQKDVPRILATWDDHDYGEDNEGADFPMKEASRNLFLDFWQVAQDAPRRSHPGIYDSAMYGPAGKEVQVLLLDLRSFKTKEQLLGEGQWRWLEEEFKNPAKVRILVSSIQVLARQHEYEKWSDYPAERYRLLGLVHRTGAGLVILISGDRHHAEISCIRKDTGGELCEVTSSPLSAPPRRGFREPNQYRVHPKPYDKHNFGVIELDWAQGEPKAELSVRDTKGVVVLRK